MGIVSFNQVCFLYSVRYQFEIYMKRTVYCAILDLLSVQFDSLKGLRSDVRVASLSSPSGDK